MFHDATGLEAAGRLLIVLYFAMSLLHDVMPEATKHHVGRLTSFHVPFPTLAFWFGLALELTGCVLLLTGWHADWGIYCLIVFSVVANALYNRYWTMQDRFKRDFCRMLLNANTGVLGGLLLLLNNVR